MEGFLLIEIGDKLFVDFYSERKFKLVDKQESRWRQKQLRACNDIRELRALLHDGV